VGPDRIVVPPPALDDDLCLLQRVEDLAIQKFIPQLRVEALAIAILPGAAGHDVGGLGA
jgi:hypothetical protein